MSEQAFGEYLRAKREGLLARGQKGFAVRKLAEQIGFSRPM